MLLFHVQVDWLVDFFAALFCGMGLYLVALLLRYWHGNSLAFETLVVLLLLLTSLFIVNFLAKKLTKIDGPFEIPRSSFICLNSLAFLVALGFAYYLVFKLAFRHCPHVSDCGMVDLGMRTAQRLLTILLPILCTFYVIKRAKVGVLGTKLDLLTRFVINLTVALFRMDIIGTKVTTWIEEFCYSIHFNSIVKVFCLPKDRRHDTNSSLCDAATERAFAWISLDHNFLHPAILSVGTEFVPVFVVVHWLACGYAEQRAAALAKRNLMESSKLKLASALPMSANFVLNLAMPEARPSLVELPTMPGWQQNALRRLSLLLLFAALGRWLLGFFVFMRSFEVPDGLLLRLAEADTFATRISTANDLWMLLFSLLQLGLRLLLFSWTSKIGNNCLDICYRADSYADKLVILSTMPFLVAGSLAHFAERLHFFASSGPRHSIYFIVGVLNLPILLNILSKCLEAMSLCTLMCLPATLLRRLRHFLPLLVVVCIGVNCVDFCGTYFSQDETKHHVDQFIRDHSRPPPNNSSANDVFIVVGIAAKLFNFSNFLFTFTCALAWLQVITRYRSKEAYYVAG